MPPPPQPIDRPDGALPIWHSAIADNNSQKQWVEDGKLDAEQRAEKLYKEMLANYVAPELDPEIDARLLAFMEAKKASFPDSNIS